MNKARSCERREILEMNKYWCDLPSQGHQFFKMMLGGFMDQLRIPTKFSTHFKGELSKRNRVVLQGPSGNKWTVELTSNGVDVFFQNGWDKFAKENGLEELDLLVFCYTGNSCFRVSIFDPSGCERECAYYVEKKRKPCPHSEIEEEKVETQEKFFVDENEEENLQEVNSESESVNEVSEADCLKGKLKLGKSDDEGQSRTKKKKQRMGSDLMKKKKKQANGLPVSHSSSAPSFQITMQHKNVYKDFTKEIPQIWAAEHMPNRSQEIQLKTPSSKIKWKAQIKNELGTWHLTGGWSKFVLDNDLGKDDVCIFMIVRGNSADPATSRKPIVLNVYIRRADGYLT